MAPKQEDKISNRASAGCFQNNKVNVHHNYCGIKEVFLKKKMYIIIKFEARISQLRYRFHILKVITNGAKVTV